MPQSKEQKERALREKEHALNAVYASGISRVIAESSWRSIAMLLSDYIRFNKEIKNAKE